MNKIKFILLPLLMLFCFQYTQAQKTRTESDLLGKKEIPFDAYYGVQTLRALENFQISGVKTNFYPDYVKAYAMVKMAAAHANADVGRMKKERYDAIEKACKAIIDGKYHDQFLTDLYQGGAGTSANMNANEVIANIALEMSGHKKGEYQYIEPHDDLNMGQSTNDVYPTAIHVALLLHNDKVINEAKLLSQAFHKKGEEFKDLLKMGRTEGQDAVPMTLGQEFHAFGSQLDGAIEVLQKTEAYLYEINMGATAIGTGLTASPGYAEKCVAYLAQITGKPMVEPKDLIAATSSMQAFVMYSSAVKNFAVVLSKIASDLSTVDEHLSSSRGGRSSSMGDQNTSDEHLSTSDELRNTSDESLSSSMGSRNTVDEHLCTFDEHLCAFDERLCTFDEHLCWFDEHLSRFDEHLYRSDGHLYRSDGHLRRVDGHLRAR